MQIATSKARNRGAGFQCCTARDGAAGYGGETVEDRQRGILGGTDRSDNDGRRCLRWCSGCRHENDTKNGRKTANNSSEHLMRSNMKNNKNCKSNCCFDCQDGAK